MQRMPLAGEPGTILWTVKDSMLTLIVLRFTYPASTNVLRMLTKWF
jgi:hypothetical protein